MSVSIADSTGRKHRLLRCPFCGSATLFINEPARIVLSAPDAPREHVAIEGCVACYDCGAAGPSEVTTAEAVVAWNERL